MNPRLAKEIRPLFFPWVLALVACIIIQVVPRDIPPLLVIPLAWTGLPLCGAFLAARVFAFEFQDRTLVLWLSQPVSRGEIWRDKFRVLLPAEIILAGLTLAMLMSFPQGDTFKDRAVIGLLSLVASVATAPFWATVARSTVGTFVFTVAFQYLAAVVLLGLGAALDLNSTGMFSAGRLYQAGAYLAFTGGLLFAGWRRFAKLEAIEGLQSFGAALTSVGPKSAESTRLSFLSPRPRGVWRNLVKKELHLQRPCFILAGVFLASAILVAFADILTTGAAQTTREVVEVLRILPFLLYGVVLALVAGTTSFCEEHSLGTRHLALTQPTGPLRQYLAKLGVSVAVFAGLGLLLPNLVLQVYGSLSPDLGALLALNERTSPLVIPIFEATLAIGFLLSFWLSSLLPNVVRAGLATLALGGIGTAATGFIYVGSSQWMPSLPFDHSSWLLSLRSQLLWSSYGPRLIDVMGGAAVLLFIVGLLYASYRNFRQISPSLAHLVQQVNGFFGILCIGVLCFAIVNELPARVRNADLRIFSAVQRQLEGAVIQLETTNRNSPPGRVRIYTWEQLAATGRLDAAILARYTDMSRTVTVSDFVNRFRPDQRWISLNFSPAMPVIEGPMKRGMNWTIRLLSVEIKP